VTSSILPPQSEFGPEGTESVGHYPKKVFKSVFRRVLFRFARSLGIFEIHARLDQLELDQKTHIQGLSEQFQDLSEQTQKVIPIIQSVDQYNETRTRKLILDAKYEQEFTMGSLVNQLGNELLIQLRRDIDGIRALATSKTTIENTDLDFTSQYPSSINDALYMSLEDRFRGDAKLVAERQKDYLPYVTPIASIQTPVLDLGCGRGEWLRLLQAEGMPARGVDGNDVAVSECQSLGLDVIKADLLTVLRSTPSQSIGVVTMFQVLEHLPFNLVIEVLREVLRVLIPGGAFIGEIPNCETLRVGASTFWIDPTHQRPLYPAVLEFIASQVGFRSVEGKYSSPLSPDLDLANVPEHLADIVRDLHYKINGPGDFAIIAVA
jgi:SAM-dependent methyltransferase